MSENTFTLRCERIEADKPNHNGNIYSEAVLKKMVAQAQARIRQRRFLGRLGTSVDRVRLSDASHIVTALRLTDDKHLEADFEVVNTPKGKELLDLFEKFGTKYYEIIPFGSGTVTAQDADTRVVGEDYRLTSLDVVPKLKPGETHEAGSGSTARSASGGEEARLQALQAGESGPEATLPQGTVFVVLKSFGHSSDGDASCLKVCNTYQKAREFVEGYNAWFEDYCDPDNDFWGTEYYSVTIEKHEIE